MFASTKYVTNGIRDSLPPSMQNMLWYMIETMQVEDGKDYLQVFQLEGIMVDGKLKQRIIHTQEQPEYRKEYALSVKQIKSEKIYVIDDKTHCTMLLAEEY
ncbi:DUF960 family protein [Cohnella sp.]|uniref:DUF960 family protein n=1 Tax=Cohnella sp. TaxID=1883426 RepID=UPI00356382D0